MTAGAGLAEDRVKFLLIFFYRSLANQIASFWTIAKAIGVQQETL